MLELGGSADTWDGVDCALYLGGPDAVSASQVRIKQLKYSGASPGAPWTVARLTYAKAGSGKAKDGSARRAAARRGAGHEPAGRREAKPMLESLHLKNVGPAPEMELRLAQRLNLITGDNGLGKSFLQEHIAAAEVRGDDPAREIIFLIDEIEAHLHPQWQRRIVPAVLNVMDALTGSHGSRVQLITATHSPLVLASVEPLVDVKKDAWFDLDLEEARVVLRKRQFVRRGEVSNWLTSEAFNLKKARSLEAESAIETALALLRQTGTSAPDKRQDNFK
ncbi:AAA family ATPase [Archangium sp.]|uniref:AAA family ATPase n=1 Tax=Archangium sp. TaxID=1872627 RepID=UPI002D4900DD|nr:AAA family ATPase [Archangium sp.]HYO55580.1 AAA family ATPase [Archangium sp.]